MTEHWLVRVIRAWKKIADFFRERYRSDRRRFIEGLIGYSGSLALGLFLLFSVVLPIPPVTPGIGLNGAKVNLVHVLAMAGILSLSFTYARSLTTMIHVLDEAPIRYIRYLRNTKKKRSDLR